jgi:hypothetical protein
VLGKCYFYYSNPQCGIHTERILPSVISGNTKNQYKKKIVKSCLGLAIKINTGASTILCKPYYQEYAKTLFELQTHVHTHTHTYTYTHSL